VHRVDNLDMSIIWNGTKWVELDRQARVTYNAVAPANSVAGDIWVDPSQMLTGGKMIVSYWDGTAWVDSSGNRTWISVTDPALDPKNKVRDGDLWVQLAGP
jgi:signal transduction histidine kinase